MDSCFGSKCRFQENHRKPVQHQARPYGTSKFGTKDLFVVSGFNYAMVCKQIRRKTDAFFRAVGTLMFIFGFFSAFWLGATKLVDNVLLSRLWKFNRRKSLVLHCINDDDYGNITVL